MCFACALPAQAQHIKPRAKTKSARHFAKARTSAHRQMGGAVYPSIALNPAYPVMPVRVGIDRSHIYETVVVTQQRSWWEQQKRDIKAWQLKRQHAKAVALQQALAALPQLRAEQTFYANDLSGLLLQESHAHQLPELPLLARPNYVYRGLSLGSDGASLRRILHHGLLLQDVGSYSNSLLMSLASTPHDAAAISSVKYTNLAQSPHTALQYAFRKLNQSKDILPVIVSVVGEQKNGAVIRVQHDIPAERIPEVMALLKINGAPTWCSVKLEEGRFKITPYENK